MQTEATNSPEAIDRVAEALWGTPANKRVVTWASMDEKVKELWRDDARRALAAISSSPRKESE